MKKNTKEKLAIAGLLVGMVVLYMLMVAATCKIAGTSTVVIGGNTVVCK